MIALLGFSPRVTACLVVAALVFIASAIALIAAIRGAK